MRRLAAVAVIVTVCLIGARASTGTTVAPCPAAPSFSCSTLTVPLDHSGRAAGQLRLAYATENGNASRGTLLFLTGGPGQPGVTYLDRIKSRLGAVFEGYRLVMFNQRGTGSGALQCPALQQQMGSTDLAVPTKAAVTSCAAAIGAKRRYFTTADTVEDIEALRIALGVQKLVLDGVSYGTFVAERYAIAHPAHVAKLVLDSVVPHDGAGLALEAANMHRVGVVLNAVCGCTRAAKDLAVVVRRRGNGVAILNALVTMSVADPRYPGVAAAVQAAASGSDGQLNAIVASWQPDHGTPAEALSQGLHASTLCADLPMPWGNSATPAGKRRPALKRAAGRLEPSALLPFNRTTAAGNGIVTTCLWWPPTPAPPRVGGRLPGVPTLLLAGDRDLSTPLRWAQLEAQRAPGGTLVVVPEAGHSVQLRAVNDAGRRAVADFLR